MTPMLTFIHVAPGFRKSQGLSSRHSSFCSVSCSSFISVSRPSRRSRLSQRSQSSRVTPRSEASLSDTFSRALCNNFAEKDITRVIGSFSAAMDGRTLDIDNGTPSHQHATSFVDGLSAEPWLDEFTGPLSWVRRLEDNYEAIREEFIRVAPTPELKRRGTNVWVPPVVEAANAYGPDWRTLVLQDRQWDPTNTSFFPNTTALLRDGPEPVPSVEAFFARQAPDTGIDLHTDFCNFILTMHLGLEVPTEQSWIEVGGTRRYWEQGKALVFNTSFFHKTMNEAKNEDRTVLLIRFWHPELTLTERDAMSFLFDMIENPDTHPASIEAAKQIEKENAGKPSRPKARGFGK